MVYNQFTLITGRRAINLLRDRRSRQISEEEHVQMIIAGLKFEVRVQLDNYDILTIRDLQYKVSNVERGERERPITFDINKIEELFNQCVKLGLISFHQDTIMTQKRIKIRIGVGGTAVLFIIERIAADSASGCRTAGLIKFPEDERRNMKVY
jgi:hypothetical protein